MESRGSERLTNRPCYNEKNITEKYSFNSVDTDNLWLNTKHYFKKYYTPNKACWKRYFKARLPIIEWLPKYNVKENLLKDMIGGLTIGVVQIPQSMGYALMAGVPPVTGLYVAFFTVLVYFFLGTCRNLSLGTYGIVSLMVASTVEKLEGKFYPSGNEHGLTGNQTKSFIKEDSSNFLSSDPEEAKIMIAATLSFFVAIFQIILGLLHAGVVTKYLSDIIVAGFTTGAAYHIVVSQLNSLLGITVKHEHSWIKLTLGNKKYFIELFSNLDKINWATVIISVISMFELYMVKHFINQKYKHRMIAPFPIELLIITLGTLFSYLFRFHENFKVNIVGHIPIGIPAPKVPPLSLISEIYFESIEIAIVSFALNISMAKLFAKRYHYSIRPNQELFSYGVGNLVSCFFRGFPSCVGLSRSVILESCGAKTLLNSAISSVIVLIVIVGIGFLFETLPIACLSSIIVVALIPMLIEVKQIVTIFKRSKVEAMAWLATFLGVMILDVDFGLYIGILFSLLLFIVQNQRARTFVMGNIPETDIYEAIDECDDAREIDGIKIIRYESSIFYANVENFSYKVIKLARVNPAEVNERINKKREEHLKRVNKINHTNLNNKCILKCFSSKDREIKKLRGENSKEAELQQAKQDLEHEIEQIMKSVNLKDLIIDFSCVNLIDSMGVDAIVNLIEIYNKIGVQVHLSHCKRYVIRVFQKSPLKDKINPDYIYPTNHDAVIRILKSRELAKAAAAVAAISSTSLSQITASMSDETTSMSLHIEKDKYEKLEGAEAAGLTPKIYLRKQEDYDIINEIVHY